jgi:hypothetical protein
MMALGINRNNIVDLSLLSLSDKEVIFEQTKEIQTIKLWVEIVLYRGKNRVSLNGVAYQNEILQKSDVLGYHTPNKKGVESIMSASECYSFDSMYELIVA